MSQSGTVCVLGSVLELVLEPGLVPAGGGFEGPGGGRGMLEEGEEMIAVAIGEGSGGLFGEGGVGFGDDAGAADAELGGADLLDEHGGTGEGLGEDESCLGVGCAGFDRDGVLLWFKNYTIGGMREQVGGSHDGPNGTGSVSGDFVGVGRRAFPLT